MNKKSIIILLFISIILIFPVVFAAFQWPTTQHYPSAKMGYTALGLDSLPPEGRDSYLTWMANHYDYFMGGGNDSIAFMKNINSNIIATSYQWFHSFSVWPGLANYDATIVMLQYTFDNNINPEDWFMHFQNNTVIGSWSSATFDEDKFHYIYVDSTKITNPAYQTSDNEAFGQIAGSILYIGHNFKFKEINFVFSTPASADWSAIWEYWNGNSWQPLTITSDTTNDLMQNGKIEFWQPPSNWQRLGGINNEKPVYWVRLRTTNAGTTKPVTQTIKGQKYYVDVDVSGTMKLVFPGWNPSQDQGQNSGVANDGIRDTPPDSISNFSGTSALIKAHSRPVTTNVLAFSGNLNNANFQHWVSDYLIGKINSSQDGLEYDSIDARGPYQFFGAPLNNYLSGNYDNLILENPTNAVETWRSNISQIMSYSKQKLDSMSQILEGNTVRQAANLEIERAEHMARRESFYGLFGHKSSYDLETDSSWKILTSDSYYRIVGKEGIKNMLNFVYSFNWKSDTTPINYNDVSTAISAELSATETNTLQVASTALFPNSGYLWIDQEKMGYTGKTATTLIGLTRGVDGTVATKHVLNQLTRVVSQESNDREKIYSLSLFYIVQNPDTDYFFPWKDCCPRWYYTNSFAEGRAFFVNAIKYDIGKPTGTIPAGYSALSNNDWGVYVIGQGSDFKIYARDYTKAITLAKPLSILGLGDASKTLINLPSGDRYYQLYENASLNMTPITQIVLRGVEGAILIKESALNPSNCRITSETISANCAAGTSTNCESGETISLSGTYAGDCSSGNFLQIDARNSSTSCVIQYSGADMPGIFSSVTPNSGIFSGAWTIPSIPSICQGKIINAIYGNLWQGTPGTGSIINGTNAAGTFKFYIPTVQPLSINFVFPTPADNSIVSLNSVLINVSTSSSNTMSSFINFASLLSAYWNLNGNVQDLSGYANHGAITGANCNVQGKFGNACSFAGTNKSYITVPDSTSLDITKDITIEFWVNPAATQTAGIVDKNRFSEWNVHLLGNGIRFEGQSLNGTVKFTSTTAPTNNVWTYVTVVYGNTDGSLKKIYYNGVEQSITIDYTGAGGLKAGIDPLFIGKMHDGYYFSGMIDEVRVWNRALSRQEILASYNSNNLYNNFTNLSDGVYIYYSYVTDSAGNSNQTAIRIVTINTSQPVQTCSDGTLYNQCSAIKPLYCSNGTLINNCTACGCSLGQSCNTVTKLCYVPSTNTCSDGTAYGNCSATKPKYCLNGTLIDQCNTCGCSAGQKCNATSQLCLKGKYKKITIAGTVRTTSGVCSSCEVTTSFLDTTSTATTGSSGTFAMILQPSYEFEPKSYVINGTIRKPDGRIYNFRRTINVA